MRAMVMAGSTAVASTAATSSFATMRIATRSDRRGAPIERPAATVSAARRKIADTDVSPSAAACINRTFWSGRSLNLTNSVCKAASLVGGPRGQSPLESCGPRPHGLLSGLLSQRRDHEDEIKMNRMSATSKVLWPLKCGVACERGARGAVAATARRSSKPPPVDHSN